MAGRIITLEGTDGSGKATQAALLKEHYEQAGYAVMELSFPQYESDSSLLVRQYLAGEFGAANDVPAKVASALFAYDRYRTAPVIRAAVAAGKVVLLDRWVSANKGHQLGKLPPAEWPTFLAWLNRLEYEVNQVPKPDLTILLHLPPAARAVVSSSAKGGVVGDIHEADEAHLKHAEAAYLWVAAHDLAEEWRLIECLAVDGHRLTPAELHEQVWQVVEERMMVHVTK